MRQSLLALALAGAMIASAAQAASPPPRPELPQVAIEIYRIAPGQHQAFLELIARFDAANLKAGLPPRQLYVHQDGADWDFIFIQPQHNPPEKSKLVDQALKQAGAPSDADFFFEIRRFVAEHSDTMALGPTTAADWLARASH
jgi:membrane-bound lytic murein transglycosylase B